MANNSSEPRNATSLDRSQTRITPTQTVRSFGVPTSKNCALRSIPMQKAKPSFRSVLLDKRLAFCPMMSINTVAYKMGCNNIFEFAQARCVIDAIYVVFVLPLRAL